MSSRKKLQRVKEVSTGPRPFFGFAFHPNVSNIGRKMFLIPAFGQISRPNSRIYLANQLTVWLWTNFKHNFAFRLMTETNSPTMASTEEIKPAEVSSSLVEPVEKLSSATVDAADATPLAASTTEIENKKYQSLDPRNVVVERIAWGIFAIVILSLAVGGSVISIFADWPPTKLHWLILAGVFVVIGLMFWAVYSLPAAAHRHASWRIDEAGLDIRRGILWRREITIPRARVQHTDVRQGPLERRYRIASLVIHTAGTHAASITLSGLAVPDAHWLRDVLISEVKASGDAV